MRVGRVENIAKSETVRHRLHPVRVWNDRDLDGGPVTFSILRLLACSVDDQTLVVLGGSEDKGGRRVYPNAVSATIAGVDGPVSNNLECNAPPKETPLAPSDDVFKLLLATPASVSPVPRGSSRREFSRWQQSKRDRQ